MREFELKTVAKNLEALARVRIAPSHHAFWVQNRKWEAVAAIFSKLGITLAKGQEDEINSSFKCKGNSFQGSAVVRATSGNYKEYSLLILNNILIIKPRVTEYSVEEKLG